MATTSATTSPLAGVARAARMAQLRGESSYAGGLEDGLAVAQMLAEQSANRAAFLGALSCLAHSVRAEFRRQPSGYFLGKLDALRDARR